ncbi:MAG: AAA family ATPase [Crocinitomicaceae bacterium]|nr:AAA family ATPase [Crocinitomicaceae bacterium]
MEDKSYSITTELKNVKSHYGAAPISFEANKPLTVIAGPNGEGKSNLIEAILFGLGNYIGRSIKLKKESSFFKEISISSSPSIKTSFNEMVFSDLIKKGLHSKKSEISFPERFLPQEMISHGKSQATITTTIHRISKRTTGVVGRSKLVVKKAGYDASIEKNTLEHLDLIYLNTDNILNDLFVKFVGQSYTEEINKIQGKRGQNLYFRKILDYYPEENDRLIQDVESGKFEEKYNSGKFISSSLPTGAKKECLLYMMGILRQMHSDKTDWLSVIVIDEVESGLHVNRKKKIVDALISAIQNDDVLKNHVRIILSTHSPVIYSELQKHPEIVDTYFILRDVNKPSVVYKQGDDVGNSELFEKRILSELGLNVYDLPGKLLFVEGPTDKLFFNEVFNEVHIQPFYTCNINKMVRDFISAFPIVRSKEYNVIVDKNGLRQLKDHIAEIENDSNLKITFHVGNIGYNSMEEFMFGVDISGGGQPSTIWNKIEQKISKWNKLLGKDEQININIKSVRAALEKRGREGLKVFFETTIKKNKKMRFMYSLIGRRYKEFLNEKEIDILLELKRTSHLKLK